MALGLAQAGAEVVLVGRNEEKANERLKVIEEAGETALAAVGGKDKEEIAGEMADLLYHTLVLMAASGVSPKR